MTKSETNPNDEIRGELIWSAVAERSGDTALDIPGVISKAAWRFASRRSPKMFAARMRLVFCFPALLLPCAL
ncbi:MAG: hypothetical protein ABSF10_02875 [Verrucomicrobiota bacterium]|jgi:hypothetical protein